MHHLNVMMQEQSWLGFHDIHGVPSLVDSSRLPAALCKKLRSFFFQNRHHWVAWTVPEPEAHGMNSRFWSRNRSDTDLRCSKHAPKEMKNTETG